MNIFSNVSKRYLTASSSVLLLFVIFIIFIIPFFPIQAHKFLYNISFTLIFLLAALALSMYRSRIFKVAVIVIIIEWISDVFDLPILNKLSLIINICFFILIVLLFIRQIAQAKKVTPHVIMESINGYLMLGLAFSILIALICAIDPTAYSFAHLSDQMDPSVVYTSNYIYFGFVTLTTLGYGDIAPLTPVAKSLSNFISVAGQMYVAIIIAALVSKYLGQKNQ
ncbi:MAG: potassium channel family protein [Flavobacteriaceae bacterium]